MTRLDLVYHYKQSEFVHCVLARINRIPVWVRLIKIVFQGGYIIDPEPRNPAIALAPETARLLGLWARAYVAGTPDHQHTDQWGLILDCEPP